MWYFQPQTEQNDQIVILLPNPGMFEVSGVVRRHCSACGVVTPSVESSRCRGGALININVGIVPSVQNHGTTLGWKERMGLALLLSDLRKIHAGHGTGKI